MSDTNDNETTEENPETDQLVDAGVAAGLAEQHRQRKLTIAERLHQYGTDAGHCWDFDQILTNVGLPARPNVREDSYWRQRYGATGDLERVVGEETADEFQKWLRETSRYFYRKIDEYGLNETGADRAMAEAGLPTKQTRPVVIEGTFTVQFTVDTLADDDTPLIDLISKRRVGQLVSDEIRYGVDDNVHWKVRYADVENNTTASES